MGKIVRAIVCGSLIGLMGSVHAVNAMEPVVLRLNESQRIGLAADSSSEMQMVESIGSSSRGVQIMEKPETDSLLEDSGQETPESSMLSDAADEFEEYRQVALTFDDGPHPVYTEELLDGLAERNVKATFFVVGKNIPGNEDLIARMEEEGHLIGNHTYDHAKICDMSGTDACEQVEKTSSLVKEITGKNTEFVRPPFGAWNKDMECSFVMIPVLWDVDSLDWTTRNTSEIVQRVLKDVEAGDIILMHDYYASSVEAALQIADELLAQGYEFVTADELILE